MMRVIWMALALSGCWYVTEAEFDRRLDVDQDGVTGFGDCDDQDSGIGAPETWFADLDGDGYGDPRTALETCDPPPGYVPTAGDCDDDAFERNPSQLEVCDGVDNDCQGGADNGLEFVDYYRDYDGDGFGDPTAPTVLSCAPLPLYSIDATDCDDLAASVNPAAQEVCSGQDDDCDGLVDLDDPDIVGEASWYRDSDGDGFGDTSVVLVQCERPPGYVRSPGDCDETRADTNPGAPDVCDDGIDQDCDGIVDNTALPVTWYVDGDGDGFGDPLQAETLLSCSELPGFAPNPLDCNDEDPALSPAAAELCDGIDNDCDGWVDDEDAGASPNQWFGDQDGDGFGAPGVVASQCEQPPGTVSNQDDCDDTDASVNPAATDLCSDGLDQDCSGVPDDSAGPFTYYTDADGDGWGDASAPVLSSDCSPAEAQAVVAGDCDDADAGISPAAAEQCDGIDRDCDGLVDLNDPDSPTVLAFTDADGDGFGDPATEVERCEVPAGLVADGSDCDDANADANPGMTELCNGFDDNCDGGVDDGWTPDGITWYRDTDGDGWGDGGGTRIRRCVAPGPAWIDNTWDCDDTDALVYHGGSCDDAEACTTADACYEGVCEGVPDGCSTCDSTCATCSNGCCEQSNCPGSTPCPTCDGCTCNLDCGGGTCSADCIDGSVCSVHSGSSSNGLSMVCDDSLCQTTCNRTDGLCDVDCTNEAVCHVACTNLDDGVCRVSFDSTSSGTVLCQNNDDPCDITCDLAVSCPDGRTTACNGAPCP